MGKNLSKIVITLLLVLFSFNVSADAIKHDEPIHKETYKNSSAKDETVREDKEAYKYERYSDSELARKIFSLGRSIGAAYYYLIDLCDKSRNNAFKTLQNEYNDALQAINIIDIILDDLKIKGKSFQDLNKIRKNFYDALQDQDLSETKLDFVRDNYVIFYENLSEYINKKYSCKESWLLSLGLYASFQLESLKSDREDKILLSGFEKIMSRRTVVVPQQIYDQLAGIYRLDKTHITDKELIALKQNLINVIKYFTNYSENTAGLTEIKDLTGIWQGILYNPDKEKYDMRLVIKDDLTASMDINGLVYDVQISKIKVINKYITFMFKPFGTEKLYLRFNAKLSQDIFSGEITDVLGQKGYCVLARTDEFNKLPPEKLDKMVSYISQFENKLKENYKENDNKPVETPVSELPYVEKINKKAKINTQKTLIPDKNVKKQPEKTIKQEKIIPVVDKNGIPPAKPRELETNTNIEMEKIVPVKDKLLQPPDEIINTKKQIKSQNIKKFQKEISEKPAVKVEDLEVSSAKEASSEKEYYEKDKGIIKRLKSIANKLFSLVKIW